LLGLFYCEQLMKRLFIFLLLPIATMAQHHNIASRTVRLAGRTAANMLTFKDKRAAVAEWGITLSFFADAYESRQVQHFCVGCEETSPLLGAHPSRTRLFTTEMALAFITDMQAQGIREVSRGDSHWLVRNVAWTAPSDIIIAGELYAATYNFHTAKMWKNCEADPACFPRYPK
jgi:hypothetical protein